MLVSRQAWKAVALLIQDQRHFLIMLYACTSSLTTQNAHIICSLFIRTASGESGLDNSHDALLRPGTLR